jgi:DNA primase
MAIQKVLGRLKKVRQKGEGQYMACCPAHDDKSPSLSVAEAKDGRILVKCFSGCGALDVITAIGLEWDDLFPESDKHYRSLAKHVGLHSTVNDRVISLAEEDERQGKRLSQEDKQRVKKAILEGGQSDNFPSELAWKIDLNQVEIELAAAERESGKQ